MDLNRSNVSPCQWREVVKLQRTFHIIMSKCLPFLKRRRRSISRSLYDAHDKSLSPKEATTVKSPQSAVPSPEFEVIYTFENGNALNKKKQAMHPGTAKKEGDATSPKLLLPIVVVLDWNVDQDFNRMDMKERNRTEWALWCYFFLFIYDLCLLLLLQILMFALH